MSSFAEPQLPTQSDVEEARGAVRFLAALDRPDDHGSIRLSASDNGAVTTVSVPRPAFVLLVELLGQLANGHAVTVVPVQAELTTQQAADLLSVSRPHLIELLENGAMPHRRVGTHRRIRFHDLMEYQRNDAAKRQVVLDALVAEAQRLNLGY